MKDNSLKTLRGFLFDEMIKIRSGEAVASESIALAKLSTQVINSYRVEIDTVKVANELKKGNKDYAKQLTAIRSQDVGS